MFLRGVPPIVFFTDMKEIKADYKAPLCKVIAVNVRQQILTVSTEGFGMSEFNYSDSDWN